MISDRAFHLVAMEGAQVWSKLSVRPPVGLGIVVEMQKDEVVGDKCMSALMQIYG